MPLHTRIAVIVALSASSWLGCSNAESTDVSTAPDASAEASADASAGDGALEASPEASEDGAPDAPSPALVHRAIVNLRPAFTDFAKLTPWIDGISHVRVWGGSRGMATYPTMEAVPELLLSQPSRYNVVKDEEIEQLLALQSEHEVRIIYLVNINDTVESQKAFVERLLSEGIDLAFLELGNEIYLSKYRTGDVTQLGVTRAWSVEQYVDEVIDGFAPALKEFGLPLYMVGASHGTAETTGNAQRKQWNQALLEALAVRAGRIDGVTFHRYAGEERTGESHEEAISNESFEFLQSFGSLPIAITESGYFFTEMTTENLDLAAGFWAAFRNALKPSDLFGVHVMYNRAGSTGDLSFALYGDDGITPVGTRFDAWLRTGE